MSQQPGRQMQTSQTWRENLSTSLPSRRGRTRLHSGAHVASASCANNDEFLLPEMLPGARIARRRGREGALTF